MIWLLTIVAFAVGFGVGRLRKTSGIIHIITNDGYAQSYIELKKPFNELYGKKKVVFSINAEKTHSL